MTHSANQVSRTVSGKVRMVKFFDVETSFWQQVSQLSTIKGKAEEYPGSSVAGGDVLMGQRYSMDQGSIGTWFCTLYFANHSTVHQLLTDILWMWLNVCKLLSLIIEI